VAEATFALGGGGWRTPGAAALCACLGLWVGPVDAQRTIPVTGDRLSGIALPIEPIDADIALAALRATAWTVDDTKRLLLEQDVRVRIGELELTAGAAVIWINRLPSAERLINQVAIYFDRLDNPGAAAGLGVAGQRVLVTASARGAMRLTAALLEERPATDHPLVQAGEERLAAHLRAIVMDPPKLVRWPQIEYPQAPPEFRPIPGRAIRPEDVPASVEVARPPLETAAPPLVVPQGTVHFTAGQLEIVTGEHENTVLALGSIVVEYVAPQKEWSRLTLSAQRAVIFTDPGPIESVLGGQLTADSIRGVYLEGNVVATADQGRYTVRAPQIYYDFHTSQAIMLDAVLRTYAREYGLPIYARAREMRQIAANQWESKRVRVSTSEFFTPHLAIGTRRVTITQRPSPRDPQDTTVHFDSRDNVLMAGNVPFLYWPRFSGTIEDIPLRQVEVGARDSDGVIIRTTWDPFTLFGLEQPKGIDAQIQVDGFTKRGAGAGLDLEYDLSFGHGALDLYGLYDEGTDRTSSGRDVEPDDDWRGIALAEHEVKLGDSWTLQAQASWISDETFVTTWRREDFAERREYESALYLKHQKENAALTLLGKYELNDFISNDDLLASRQYQVEKLPELTYRRYGDAWFDRFTYSMEARASRMRLHFEESTPNELGVPAAAFGVSPDEPVSDALEAEGLTESFVNRFDARHELAFPVQLGPFKAVPFVVGRITRYNEDFASFSDEADKTRWFGAAGIRVSGQFHHVDNTVESQLLDLHRVRHIIEPSLTLWYGASSVSAEDLPVYDQAVEPLGTGAALNVALRNTWQTQRGGPGRWQSVDVLTLNTALTLNSSDVNKESPTPQFFDYRPEYSQFGDHVAASAVWLLSDTFSILGQGTYDLDESAVSRGSIGAELRHTPLLSTHVEFRYLDASDNELLGVGWRYQLTPKYTVQIDPQWDFRADDFRAIGVRVTRRFPEFDLIVEVRHDEIEDDTIIGASLGRVLF
jgi:hypothetical protein